MKTVLDVPNQTYNSAKFP